MLEDAIIEAIKRRYGFSTFEDIQHIPVAERGVVHKAKLDGTYYMVKIMHRTTELSGLLYMCEFTSYLSMYIPEVSSLENTIDGKAYIEYNDSLLVIGKWLKGEKIFSCEPWILEESAKMLAKLHKHALDCPIQQKRPDRPTYEDLDWESNIMFNMDTVKKVLFEDSASLYETSAATEHVHVDFILSKRELILEEHKKTSNWMKGLTSSGRQLLWAPIHGDIYLSNILWEDERICAVLDWDECQYEPLVYELGRVLWEFCKDEAKTDVDATLAERFLQAYFEAGGPVPQEQTDLILPYIRLLRIVEVLFYIVNSVIGDYWNAEYTVRNLKALENLPSVSAGTKSSPYLSLYRT